MEKEDTREISAGKKFLFLIIILFLFILLIEGLLSMYYYQRSGGERTASLEAIKTIKKKIIGEHDILAYEPWVEYRNKNFEDDNLHTFGLTRKSVPASLYTSTPGDTLDIYFFGGSTMFGVNVADNQTIPSQFIQLYSEKYQHARPIRVFNYGISNYYSYQELILLADLIQKGHRPDILVFLDGINDFRYGIASYYRQSYFSHIFRQFFNDDLRSTGQFKFVDTSDAMSKDPDYLPVEDFNKTLLTNYISNMENIKLLSEIINAKAYFFCQPSPFYNYPNQQNDPVCFKDNNTRFNTIYPLLKNMADSLPDFTYLGDMLADEKDRPFVDSLHYSPSFIKKIAKKILTEVEKDLSGPQ